VTGVSSDAVGPGGAAVLTDEVVLRLEGLSKTFGGTQALKSVDLEVARGEIHALVGANGSGKSTLIKILAGYHDADPGARAWIAGEELDLGSSSGRSRHSLLRFVHQDLGLVLEMSAMDNLALRGGFARAGGGRVDWKAQATATETMLARFKVDLDINAPLSEASPVERTVVAVAGAMQGWDGGEGVLVLDEPTAVLPPGEVARLLDIVREVRNAGTSVIYVSHRLDELIGLADRVSVLRDGGIEATLEMASTTTHEIADLMVGRQLAHDYRAGIVVPSDAPVVLELEGVHTKRLHDLSLSVRRGEILGLAGLDGSGREDLPLVMAGAAEIDAVGRVRFPQDSADWYDLATRRRPRLPMVPAQRDRDGVLSEMSVMENTSLAVLSRLGPGLRLDRSGEMTLADSWIEQLSIETAGRDAAISTLSGGNQQKVVIARCLAEERPILLLCEPTAGVDIGTRIAIYKLIAEQVERGLTVVISSTDTGDLLALCSRVVVLRDGDVMREIEGSEITELSLVHAMEGSDS
jgi:ribose transport system ATP-binding protein